MKKNSFGQGVKIFLIIIVIMTFIGKISNESGVRCIRTGCNNKPVSGSSYCYQHKVSSSKSTSYGNSSYNMKDNSSSDTFNSGSTRGSDGNTTSNYSNNKTNTTNQYSHSNTTWKSISTSTKKSTYHSYDEGYDDIYMNEDYDSDRYNRDSDYADGVDDAMDELDEDY